MASNKIVLTKNGSNMTFKTSRDIEDAKRLETILTNMCDHHDIHPKESPSQEHVISYIKAHNVQGGIIGTSVVKDRRLWFLSNGYAIRDYNNSLDLIRFPYEDGVMASANEDYLVVVRCSCSIEIYKMDKTGAPMVIEVSYDLRPKQYYVNSRGDVLLLMGNIINIVDCDGSFCKDRVTRSIGALEENYSTITIAAIEAIAGIMNYHPLCPVTRGVSKCSAFTKIFYEGDNAFAKTA